jgi:hypothetical protein
MIGGGGGLGGLGNPRDPNRYIEEWVLSQTPLISLYPETDEVGLLFMLQVSLDLAPFPWLRLQSATELAYAGLSVQLFRDPDSDADAGLERSFGFYRISETLVGNLEVSVNEQETLRAFLGGGGGVHHVVFEEHSALMPGGRIQLGFSLLQERIRADAVLVLDFVRGESDRVQTWRHGQSGPFMLDFSSLHLDLVIHYNLVP